MNRQVLFVALAILILIVLASAVFKPALAQTGGGYDLTWNTIDGGGGTSTGGAYSLSGTAGQPDAGAMSGGSYTLKGGFWVDFLGNRSELPLLVR